MKRIKNKQTARKLFMNGQTIYLFPCKANIHCVYWEGGYPISREDGYFDRLVRSYEYYNCNNETGYYAHYYIKEEGES